MGKNDHSTSVLSTDDLQQRDNEVYLALSDVLGLPDAEQAQGLRELLLTLDQSQLINMTEKVFNIAKHYTHACDEAVELHLLINSDMHPDRLDYNKPSLRGAINGLILSSKIKNKSVLCESCAYQPNTMANSSLSTQSDLAHAIAESEVFYCHIDLENQNNPTKEDRARMRPCKGWAQHCKKNGNQHDQA